MKQNADAEHVGRIQCHGCPKPTGDTGAGARKQDNDVTSTAAASGGSPGRPRRVELWCDFKSWLQCRYSHYHNKKLLIAVSSVCAPDKHVFRNLNLFQFSSKTAIVCKTPSQHLYFMNIGCCVQKFWTANWSKITAHTVPPHSRKQRQSNHWSYNLNVAPTKMDLFSLCL